MTRPARGLAALVAFAAAVSGCRSAPAPNRRLEQLRAEHAALHRRLAELVAKDPLLTAPDLPKGDVVLGLRSSFVETVFVEVARRYLDRVVLDIVKDIDIIEGGDVKPKTFIGTIRAGSWKVRLTIHRIRGVLKARTPHVAPRDAQRISLHLPVSVESGSGTASLRFWWDASGVANMMCKDFDVQEEISGTIAPDVYTVDGDFLLSGGSGALNARPVFPDKPFRLRVDLGADSWARLRRALENQDTFGKCAIGIDPDTILSKLKDLGAKGFDVKLPRSLFRAVALPASVQQSVEVEDRRVELSVEGGELKVTPQAVWYAVGVGARVAAPPPSAAPAARE